MAQEQFWREVLAGDLPETNLPGNKITTARGEKKDFEFMVNTRSKLESAGELESANTLSPAKSDQTPAGNDLRRTNRARHKREPTATAPQRGSSTLRAGGRRREPFD